ncbi:MAG: TolC family protein [Phycisphaerae bacterium]
MTADCGCRWNVPGPTPPEAAGVMVRLVIGVVLRAVGGCTVHPKGEKLERAKVEQAGRVYVRAVEERDIPVLGPGASVEEMVRYALLTNAGVEQKYCEWRSALEQVPQEGTQRTNLALSLSTMVQDGVTAWKTTNIGAGNDSMNNLVLPNKLMTAAEVALANARAAGKRFDEAKYELRAKVISAYDDYALTAELLRLEEENGKLLELTVKMVRLRIGTGVSMQQDLLRAENEASASENELGALRSKLSVQRAALNVLMNRDPETDIALPGKLPAAREISNDDAELLRAAAEGNPEIQALAAEVSGRRVGITMAKQAYQPELGVNVSTDFAGMAQNLAGAVMVPVLRYEAIDAGIRQAEDQLRATETGMRQYRSDLRGRVVTDLIMIREAERQVAFLEKTLIPRAKQIVSVSQTAYGTGQSSMLDLIEGQRSLIGLQRLGAEMRVEREKSVADLEAAVGVGVE